MNSGLSDHVLNLKFMTREVDPPDGDEEADSGMENDSPDQKPIKQKVLCVDPSFNSVYDLSSGRWSFQNFNPQLEYQLGQSTESNEKEDGKIEEERTEERYSSVTETIGKKFKSRRSRAKRSKKQNIDQHKSQNTDVKKGEQNLAQKKNGPRRPDRKFLRPVD